MNESENNFNSLRRLLALKRHEIPPPGYFENFSGKVLARLRAGETAAPENFFARLLRIFEFQPAFAVASVGALCLLLVFGIVLAEHSDSTAQPFMQSAETASAMPTLTAVSPPALPQSLAQNGIVAATNPVFNLQPAGSLFGQQNPLLQPVSFSSGN